MMSSQRRIVGRDTGDSGPPTHYHGAGRESPGAMRRSDEGDAIGMVERDRQPAATPARAGGMTRGIAHAITLVIAALVGSFALLFILARAQDEGASAGHPLDFLLDLYRATGVVEAFFATALAWLAIFAILTELLVAAMTDRSRALRSAILVEIVAFGGFIALWYLPL
jgi:hypothetical protein